MKLNSDKFNAITGLAIDKLALDFIQELNSPELQQDGFAYSYRVLLERNYIKLTIEYLGTSGFEKEYFYDITGAEDGAIKITLNDSNEEEVVTLEFEPEYDFNKLVRNQRESKQEL